MKTEKAHLFIEGKVQGVFFRASAKEQADKLGLNGWVRNLSDGSVEIQVEGEKETLKRFLEWCKTGPPNALVTNVDLNHLQSSGEFCSFSIIDQNQR